MAKSMKRAELVEKYKNPDWRSKYVDLVDLVSLLRDSIIMKSYKISDEFNDAILLSQSGIKVRDLLVKKEQVHAKEAKLLTLLGLVHEDPLIDIEKTNLSKLELTISNQIREKLLIYPFIYGRELYDKASELFPEERDYLRHEDTLKVMEGLPQGVFHAGHYLVGPYGIIRTEHYRNNHPTTSVPMRHCSDHGCSAVHRVQLSTSINAEVNKDRPALNKVLDQINQEPSEWNGFMTEIIEDMFNIFDSNDISTIPELLGDGFSDTELRTILIESISFSKGRTLRASKLIPVNIENPQTVLSLNRAELLQLLLTESDEQIVDLLDHCVRTDAISVPAGEIRRAKVNAGQRSAAWRLQVQLSSFGVRTIGSDSGLPLLRLSEICRSLFNPSDAAEIEELAWILRSTPGSSAEDRLEEFMRSSSPAKIVEDLILARRANAEKICAQFNIPLDQSDEVLTQGILWKLGFPPEDRTDIRDSYWKFHERLENFVRTAGSNLGSNEERLRELASNYFVTLERFLMDSLSFISWALLNDHYVSEQAFVFIESDARDFTRQNLDFIVEKGNSTSDTSKDPSLSEILQGYNKLSRKLLEYRERAAEVLRATSVVPKFVEKTKLQKFPFLHTVPFLDLTAESQVKLIASIAAVGSDLNDSGIMTARNGLLHAKNETPTVTEVRSALSRSRSALDLLEEIGGVRTTFRVRSSTLNSWGRREIVLGSNGKRIVFSSPSSYEWLRLPSFFTPQYLVHGAIFALPNQMLRFREGFSSEYQKYWAGYEHRPEPGNRILSSQSENLATGVETGSYISAKAD